MGFEGLFGVSLFMGSESTPSRAIVQSAGCAYRQSGKRLKDKFNRSHSLKMQVIAEGVETAAQLAYLREHRCDQIQGYYFSPPLALAELEQILFEQKCLPAADDGQQAGAG